MEQQIDLTTAPTRDLIREILARTEAGVIACEAGMLGYADNGSMLVFHTGPVWKVRGLLKEADRCAVYSVETVADMSQGPDDNEEEGPDERVGEGAD